MTAYIFVLAAAIAVLPIVFLFKISVEKIKENPDMKEKAQTNFFIGVAIAETIPIILIVFGMINLTPVTSIEELFTPGLIILLLMGFAAFFIFLQRTVDVTEETKGFVNNFAMIGLALANAIPIVSIVSLLMMLP